MGLRLKKCVACGERKMIGSSKKRCKSCRKRSMPWIGIEHAARQQQNQANTGDGDSYLKRTVALLKLGFSSYEQYLKSDLWANIRIAAYKIHGKKCLICRSVATEIHHLDYSLNTLKGFNIGSLIPICDECHKTVEFEGDRKRPVIEVQRVTLSLLTIRPGNGTIRRCVNCGSEVSGRKKGRRRTLCKKCCNSRSLD